MTIRYREIKDEDLLSLQRLMLALGYSVEADGMGHDLPHGGAWGQIVEAIAGLR